MSEEIKAIETKYKGCRFRSRLEARWAVLMDKLGVVWEYEKEGFELGSPLGRYLPDFFLPEHNLWLELKGQQFTDDETSKLFMLAHLSKKSVVGVVGLVEAGQLCTFQDYRIEADRKSNRWFQQFPTFGGLSTGTLLSLLQSDAGLDFATCPVCRGAGVYIKSTALITGTRGWDQMLFCYCGDCCDFTLSITATSPEKTMRVRLVDVQRSYTDLVLFLANGDSEKRAEAINAARAARFEFGETPK